MSEARHPADPLPREALALVLDLLIPPSADGRFPGAGELGLAGYVVELAQRTPGLAPLLAQGLAALEAGALRRGAQGFAGLQEQARLALLQELASSLPGFVPTLLFLTYTGYYREPRVLAALGLEARPPFPKGYAVAESDLGLLERVRARGTLYREC
jgi:hypothetical protein